MDNLRPGQPLPEPDGAQNVFLPAMRLGRLAWAIVRFFLLPVLAPLGRRPSPAVRARHCVEYLGGAWVKVGQSLALRFDLLPPEYCNEFLKLLNEFKTFPYDVVRGIVKEELGAYPEEIFATFDPVPLAAASIGQVHAAAAWDGTRLAVKVQRPRIGELFHADFRVMRGFASALDFIGVLGVTSARSFVEEFARWTEEEIDYRTEARNTHRAWLFSRGDSTQVDAKVRFEYTTRRILATEMLDGISVLDVLRAVRSSDRDFLRKLAEDGHDVRRIGRNIGWNMLNQIFRDGYFHADIHPANLFVLRGDAIGYIDYGIVGRLPDELQSSLRAYLRNLLRGNFEAATGEFLRWLAPSLKTDVNQARRDLLMILEDHRYGQSGSAGAKEFQMTSGFLMAVMAIVRKHDLSLTRSLMLYFKAMMTTDAVVFELVPDFDVAGPLKKFFEREVMLDLTDSLAAGRMLQTTWAFKYQVTQMLSDIGRIQNSGRTIEVSLETLRATLIYYGVCAAIVGGAAYIFGRTQIFETFFNSIGLDETWVTRTLYAGAALLLFLMWRQGRKVKLVTERGAVTRQGVFAHRMGSVQ